MNSSEAIIPALEIASLFFKAISIGPTARVANLWDGEVLRADDASDLLHEVAHYQVAPAWRRHTPCYGLGYEPEGMNKVHPQKVSTKRADYEEELSSILGILWEYELGLHWKNTFNSHGWAQYSYPPGQGPKLKTDMSSFETALKTSNGEARVQHLRDIGLVDGIKPLPVLAGHWKRRS